LRKQQERDGTCFRLTLPLDAGGVGTDNSKSHRFVSPIKLRAMNGGRHYTFELPRINPLYEGREHRYSYGFTFCAGDEVHSKYAIVKQDHLLSLQGAFYDHDMKHMKTCSER